MGYLRATFKEGSYSLHRAEGLGDSTIRHNPYGTVNKEFKLKENLTDTSTYA